MGGSSAKETKQEPWEPQQDYLKDIFKTSQDYFNQANTRGPWMGDMYAPEDPRTAAAQNGWYEMNRLNTGVANNGMNYTNQLMSNGLGQGQDWLNQAAGTFGNYQNAQNWASGMANQDFLGRATPFSNEKMGGPSGPLANILQGGQKTGWGALDNILKGGQSTGNAQLDAILKGGQSTGNQQLDAILKGGQPSGWGAYDKILQGGQKTGNAVLDNLAAGIAPGGILGQTLDGP
jgi:hypothetical protein